MFIIYRRFFATTNKKLSNLMRKHIRPQIKIHKQEYPKCDVCGTIRSLECHHVSPFINLRNDFLQTYYQRTLFKHRTYGYDEKILYPIFTHYKYNTLAIEMWQRYHLKNGVLQSLCKKCHRIHHHHHHHHHPHPHPNK
jgi:hypothetical protein